MNQLYKLIMAIVLVADMTVQADAWITGIFPEQAATITSAENWDNFTINRYGERRAYFGSPITVKPGEVYCTEKFIIPWKSAQQQISITTDNGRRYIIQDDDWKIRMYEIIDGHPTEMLGSPIAITRNNTCWYIIIRIHGELHLQEASDTNQCLREIGAGPCARSDIGSLFECTLNTVGSFVSIGFKAVTAVPVMTYEIASLIVQIVQRAHVFKQFFDTGVPQIKVDLATIQNSSSIISKARAGINASETIIPLMKDVEPIATTLTTALARVASFSADFSDALKDIAPNTRNAAELARALERSLEGFRTLAITLNRLAPHINHANKNIEHILSSVSLFGHQAFLQKGSLFADINDLIQNALTVAQNLAPRFAPGGDIHTQMQQAFPAHSQEQTELFEQIESIATILPLTQELANQLLPILQQTTAIALRITAFVQEGHKELATIINESVAATAALAGQTPSVYLTPERLLEIAQGLEKTIQQTMPMIETMNKLLDHLQTLMPKITTSMQGIKKITQRLK